MRDSMVELHRVAPFETPNPRPLSTLPNPKTSNQVYDEKSKMYMVLDLVTGGELFDR